MRKKVIFAALLALCTLTGWAGKKKIIAQKKGGITFVVDGKLPSVEKRKAVIAEGIYIASELAYKRSKDEDVQNIIASSFGDEQVMYLENDAFYQCIVRAYANHQSVVLTPDMIWLLISQGFSRYVNAHSEEMRSQLVYHEGKMDLVVKSEEDLLSKKANWPKLMGDFASEISKNTKGDIAQTITADFTTTSPIERVASQITLMESVKTYFEYIAMRLSCGIPSITLKGTPEDWQQVLDKTRKLEAYGMNEWLRNLEPILTEFVRTAEGKYDRKFWKGMVKKQPTDKLKGGGCSLEEPTQLDGWLLKFFPDEDGVTLDSVAHTKNMPAECVRVNFKYRIVDPLTGTVLSETPLELRAGFVGAEEDSSTNTLTPKIGWFVHKAIEESKENKEDRSNWIELPDKQVEDILQSNR